MKTILLVLLLSALAFSPTLSSATDHPYKPHVMQWEDLLPGWRGMDGESVPPQYWSHTIRELKPIRVFVDKLNIAVVTHQEKTQEKAQDKAQNKAQNKAQESGIYIVTVVSSYHPKTESGREFIWDEKTKTMLFKFTKK